MPPFIMEPDDNLHLNQLVLQFAANSSNATLAQPLVSHTNLHYCQQINVYNVKDSWWEMASNISDFFQYIF